MNGQSTPQQPSLDDSPSFTTSQRETRASKTNMSLFNSPTQFNNKSETEQSDDELQKKAKPKKAQCPCGQSSRGKAWILKCFTCNQSWHTSCSNLKGSLTKEFVESLSEWECPWCWKCTFSRPTKHPAARNEDALLTHTLSSSIVQNVTDSLSDFYENIFDNKYSNITNVSVEDNNSKFEDISSKLSDLTKSITELKDSIHPSRSETETVNICESTDPVSPLKTMPTINTTHNMKNYDLHTPDYLSPEEAKELFDFLKTESYTSEGDRGVSKYGVHYKYMGSKANTKPLPPTLENLMNKINKEFVDDDHLLNSCLVNRYEKNTDELPTHTDDEKPIDPNSSIYTVSVGVTRSIIFKENTTGSESQLKCSDGSLYTMSRKSQNFFQHRMDAEPDAENDVRFSITFRAIHWTYLNSTHLVGDSNFGKIKMGSGRGRFGSASPGLRSFVAKIDDIDPCDSASYSNVVLMVGTNDLKEPNLSKHDIRELYKRYKHKIELIRSMNKKCKIVVCPVLPTKYFNINQQINIFNQLLYGDLFQSSLGVAVVEGFRDTFLDPGTRLLRRDLSRDNIHLSDTYGVCQLVRLIKQTILSLKKDVDRRHSSSTYALVVRGGPA